MLSRGDFEEALTGKGFEDFKERLTTACEGNVAGEGKLFVQLYCADPSEVTISDEEAAWVGLEYDFSTDGDTICLHMKLMIFIGIIVGGTIGGWLGATIDHGNWFGAWSLLLSTAGSLAGIWAGYKAGQYFE